MTSTDAYCDGTRVVRAGEVVRIKNTRGRFHVIGFDLDAGTVDCYGGTRDRWMHRTFPLARLGAVDREATRRRQDA